MAVIMSKESRTKFKKGLLGILKYKTTTATYLRQGSNIMISYLYPKQSLSLQFLPCDPFLLDLIKIHMTIFTISLRSYSNWTKTINNDNLILKYNI